MSDAEEHITDTEDGGRGQCWCEPTIECVSCGLIGLCACDGTNGAWVIVHKESA